MMENETILHQFKPDLPPPGVIGGPWIWVRDRFLSSPGNIAMTLLALGLIYLAVPPFVNWVFIHGLFSLPPEVEAGVRSANNRDCVGDGACWLYVRARIGQFIYGFYPPDQRWRVNITFLLMVIGVGGLVVEGVKGKKYFALFLFGFFPFIAFWLLHGGLGLSIVPTGAWGGMMLTIIVGGVAIVLSPPLGVLLALGRRSDMTLISKLCVILIEFIRGVPLITILFMANIMLPLFLPPGVNIDVLVRILIGVALFGGAYIAEVVRGGLAAVPKGQFEAAQSLGLGYWRMMGLIVLPQALRIALPGIVNVLIGMFKDTTLVAIVGLFDFLNIIRAGSKDPNWLGLEMEGFVFAAMVYWMICFSMSRYSAYLEKKLDRGHKR